jgi:hypothetical protein
MVAPACALLAVSSLLAQMVNPPPAAAPQTNPPAPATPSTNEEVVEMSPFQVQASATTGYYSANTLAGTRLNNNIADLASSITVVTAQQLEDTASQNINDVFRYEANTEGARTYTPFVLIRSNLQDALGGIGGTTGVQQSALATGNRVRGLSTADQEEDNFFSLNRLPFDSYNTQSIEINRGPNSIIFGTGSPAGIVNQSRIQANADTLSGQVTVNVGSWGKYRETFGVNIPVVKDRLGIYVAQMFDSEGFEQKPSSDLTRRQYGAFVFYPFNSHKTKISGSFENFINYGNDPNGITPLDYVSPWLAAGRPVWNPITDMVTYTATGKTAGPYTISSTYPNYTGILQTMLTTSTSPYFVPGLTVLSASHRVEFIDQGNLENMFNGSQTGMSITGWVPTTFTPAQALVNEERMTTSTNLPTPSHYATWYIPSVVSKGIYDWSSININSLDNTATTARTYNLNYEQELLPILHLQVSWFRQEMTQLIDAPLAQANATQLYVDTNAYLPTGAINPHLGQPFVDVYQADVYSQPEINNNWRVMLAFEPDLRKWLPNWMSFLGHHRFLGIFTQHDDVTTALRYRPGIDGGDLNYLPTPAALASTSGYSYASANSAVEQWFYLGGATSAGNGYGSSSPGFFNRPGYGGPTVLPIQTYNYTTGQWATTQIHMDSLLYATGGLTESLQDSKTFFWQSFFWKDRIVGSLGINDDEVKNRNTIFPTVTPAAVEFTNGMANQQYWYNEGPWNYIGGNTSTQGVVVHAFKDWAPIDQAADRGNLFAGVLRTLSFTFNKSDNFNPPAAYYTDFFGNSLGKPEGKEKDYGLEIATPNNKFFARVTWFKTINLNQIVSLTSTGRANYIDQNELKAWATDIVEIQNGQLPSDQNFGNTNVYPITTAMQSQISALTGLPYTFGGNVGSNGEYVNENATESGQAKGVEIELTYNPLPNWTMKFTWGKQQTTITGAGAQAQAYVDSRLPAWQKYTAPAGIAPSYTLYNGKTLSLQNFWNGYGFSDVANGPGDINGWVNTAAYYNVVEATQLLIDEANNGALAPNQREYDWSFLTNYSFIHGTLRGASVGGAVSYDGQATAGYYGDSVHLNAAGQIAAPNILTPIYTPGRYHLDAWVAYTFKLGALFGDKVTCKVQFNVEDLTSNGYLLPVSFNMDGSPAAERIIPPRQYSLSAKFAF